jgi:hypothetical protein
MPRFVAKPLVATQYLPNGATGILYTAPTVPANKVIQITSFIIANTTVTDRTFNLYNVPAGGSPSGSNKIFGDCPIPLNTTWIETVGGEGVEIWTMAAGGTIQGDCAAASAVTVTISGREITD